MTIEEIDKELSKLDDKAKEIWNMENELEDMRDKSIVVLASKLRGYYMVTDDYSEGYMHVTGSNDARLFGEAIYRGIDGCGVRYTKDIGLYDPDATYKPVSKEEYEKVINKSIKELLK